MIKLTVVTTNQPSRTVDVSDDEDIKEIIDGIVGMNPGAMVHIKIVQGSRVYRMLSPLADLWLAANPAFRIGSFTLGAMMIATAVYLHLAY